MKLYYFPSACSQASNIALREAGLKFELVKVDRHTKKAADGLDFNTVNPKGYVPALTLDSGETLTENVAVLQYIGDRNPALRLTPAAGTMERYRLIEWLAFINSEIHKTFSPLFRPDRRTPAVRARRNSPSALPPAGAPWVQDLPHGRAAHRGGLLSFHGAQLGAVREAGSGQVAGA
jgi:glutathione S-transferase